MDKNTITEEESKFIQFKMGSLGSFSTKLYQAFMSADHINSKKLISVYPELSVVQRYQNEPGYWEDLKRRASEIFIGVDEL
jgi:hypothetical protein